MCGEPVEPGIGQVVAGLDSLTSADVVALDDGEVCQRLQQLVTVENRLRAELIRLVDVHDRRGLAGVDGFASTKAWVQAFARVSGRVAHRWVKAARLLRQLPKLAEVSQGGEVPVECVEQVVRLAGQVGGDRLGEIDPALADAARELDPASFELVCERVRAHLVPDGGDPAERFATRTFTLSPVGGMVATHGQLDPEGGAALATALDAVMAPPADGDERTAGQRRADALVELARRSLAAGELPTVGGQRPQVGVLLYPQALSPETLAKLAEAQQSQFAAARLRDFLADAPAPAAAPAAEPAAKPPDAVDEEQSLPVWTRPGWADPPHLNWVGPIPVETAQRIACDADVFRLILDPASGMPLDVGRSHRLVPYWMRRALWVRDRTCRWIGCTVPVQWTDSHHVEPWADGGETKVERLLSLCRHHHVQVHEGGWSIDLDQHTGEVHITRPGGLPYQVPKARSRSWNGPATQWRPG